MDEDLGVKAPVTRLRRRMSVEAEDSPSTTPSTPTKKRTTRLAAKPQLELINEVAAENVPKRSTRKTAVKEVDADTITGTPTLVTPSRRSTRIRSNTSILSENTTQNVESPRAKRALRRTSQLGSDTESTLTPARQTRRTRRDSSTNVDKQAGAVDENAVTSENIKDKEKTSNDSKENDDDNHSPSTRRSPRLQNKKDGKMDVKKPNNKTDKALNNLVTNKTTDSSSVEIIENNEIDKTSPKAEIEQEKLSTSAKEEIKINLNKSTSAIKKIESDLKNNRNRTKSWTTFSSPPSNVSFMSDNEDAKEKVKNKTPKPSILDSGDDVPTNDKIKYLDEIDVKSPNKSMNASKPLLIENKSLTKEFEDNKSDTVKLFENSPHHEAFVLIEDSDSGSCNLNIDIMDGEDQCVPIVANSKHDSPKTHEQSVEPMDIDESMPVNVTIDDFSDKSNTSKDDVEVTDKRKSSVTEKSMSKDESVNKSKISSMQTVSETAKDEEDTDVSISKPNKDSSMSTKDISNKSFAQVTLETDANESRKSLDKAHRKSSTVDKENDEKIIERINKSSVSINNFTVNESRKSSLSVDEDDCEKLNKSSNKSKRQSATQNTSGVNQNANESRKSSMSLDDDDKGEKLDKSANKSKRKSAVQNTSRVNQNAYETRKSSISLDDNDDDNEKIDKSSNKSKIKSALQNTSGVNQNASESRKTSMSLDDDDKLDKGSTKSKRNSSLSQNNSVVNQKSIVDESNETKRTPRFSHTDLQNLENTENENKSTIIIPQIKDASMIDTNNVMSPNITNELSKSMDGNIKNKSMDKKNLSLNYLTSTPIQQKPLQKLTMQINTSIISPAVEIKNNTNKKKNTPKKSFESDSSDETDEDIKFKNKKESNIFPKKKFSRAPSSSDSTDEESEAETKTPIKKLVKKSPKKKVPALESSDSDEESDSKSQQNIKKTLSNKLNDQSKSDSKVGVTNKKPATESSDSDGTDEEASKDRSKMVDDEASEASDAYESGDSRNEEDRLYEAEHEIVEKGETLDSDEDISNDSDYEKDSFIVSSDAEDEDILSGTGDDLSLSDNELTMGAKSKKKFNERKLKQQKKASREMYEARHKDESAQSARSETAKIKKSKRQRLESSTLEPDENTQPKKRNRPRIDSSQDNSMDKSDADESIRIKKKKSKRLSESVHDITINEKEITFNQSTTEKNDPLSVAIKQEPKTPLKNFNISTVAINDKIEEVQVDSNTSLMKQNETSDPLQANMMADDVDDSSSSDNIEIIQNYDSLLNSLSMPSKKIKTIDTSLNFNKKLKESKDPVIDQLNLTKVKKTKKHKKTVEPKQTAEAKDEEEFSDSIDMKLLFPEDSNDSEINVDRFKPKTNEEPAEEFIPLKRTEAQTNIPENMNSSVSEINVSKKKDKKHDKQTPEVPNNYEEETLNTGESENNKIKIFLDTTGTHQELDTSIAQTNSSKKKKNKKNKSMNEELATLETAQEIDCTDGVDIPVEGSFSSEKKKKKNKTSNVSVNNVENSFTVTEVHREKKYKKSESTSEFVETPNENTSVIQIIEQQEETIISAKKKGKKKNSESMSAFVETPNENMGFVQILEPQGKTGSSAKKAKKISISVEDVEPESQYIEPAETSIKSEKKKRNKKKNKQNLESSQTIVDNTGEESDDAPMEMSYKSQKKSDAKEIDTIIDEAATSSEKKKHKKNKKKKNKNLSQSLEKSYDNVGTTEQDVDGSIKRKRKTSDNAPIETAVLTVNENKKRKIHLDDECIAAYDTEQNNEDEGNSKKSKKKKKSKNHDNNEEVIQHISKKRKNRDDDSEEKMHKISKQNSFDKIHVPKIPESVIKQLTENPLTKVSGKIKHKKKADVIATMPFVVEEAERRKNKPSNYLEQSVYLNDSPVKKKHKKHPKDKPKVLPFTPTALTSDSGYTSKFNINVLPGQTQFVAQANNVENFREAFLGNQRIKKLGTFERFKIHRSYKISKF